MSGINNNKVSAGWAFVKYEQMDAQLKSISAQAAQLERSADAARQGSVWSELLEPIAKRWGGALKAMAIAIVAASCSFILVGVGAWVEVRRLRFESDTTKRLQGEILRLKAENEELRRVAGRIKDDGSGQA